MNECTRLARYTHRHFQLSLFRVHRLSTTDSIADVVRKYNKPVVEVPDCEDPRFYREALD